MPHIEIRQNDKNVALPAKEQNLITIVVFAYLVTQLGERISHFRKKKKKKKERMKKKKKD